MAARAWENVWAELLWKARELMVSRRPLGTLGRGVSNRIVAVGPTAITRRSSEPKQLGADSAINASQVQKVWESLENGGSGAGAAVAFAYSLFVNLIDGIEYTTSPLALTFVDRAAAEIAWKGPALWHFLVKWSPAVRTDTIEVHQLIAERERRVWWGLIGAENGMGQQRLHAFRHGVSGERDAGRVRLGYGRLTHGARSRKIRGCRLRRVEMCWASCTTSLSTPRCDRLTRELREEMMLPTHCQSEGTLCP